MISKAEQEQLFGPARNIGRSGRVKVQKKPEVHEFQQLEDLTRCSICFEKYQRPHDEVLEFSDVNSTKSHKFSKCVQNTGDESVKILRIPRILQC